jgi:hypothetical protein
MPCAVFAFPFLVLEHQLITQGCLSNDNSSKLMNKKLSGKESCARTKLTILSSSHFQLETQNTVVKPPFNPRIEMNMTIMRSSTFNRYIESLVHNAETVPKKQYPEEHSSTGTLLVDWPPRNQKEPERIANESELKPVPKKKYLEEYRSTSLVVDWPSRAPKEPQSITIEIDSKSVNLRPFLENNGIGNYNTARQLVIARLNRGNK